MTPAEHGIRTLTLLVAGLVALPCQADAGASSAGDALPETPEALYGELFEAVQSARLFEDQKLFADALPLADPELIGERFALESQAPGFDLRAFVAASFSLPVDQSVTPPAGQSLREHITWLWPALTRSTPSAPPFSSLLPLPEPYVVPGGRFREVYYWDSYFTMLGLAASGEHALVSSMLDNFAYEIDRIGHIPNGNRSYYLSRSQPPFFSHMVELQARLAGAQVYATYLPQLLAEHSYWMAGLASARPGQASAHVVVLPDGSVLNRYWDALDTPRSEAYAQDVATAQAASGRPASEVYRDLRAAAESGWDFSSRWLGENGTLASIRTTSIIPVDLNSLLFHLETSIMRGCRSIAARACVRAFEHLSSRRARAIERYLWNEHGSFYADYDLEQQAPRQAISAATLYPLFVGLARPARARATAEQVRALLLEAGGLATSTEHSGQQWDAPNGWAPLHWVAIVGLERYGEQALARQVGTRFLSSVSAVYAAESKLVEKYDVEAGSGGGGGEYPVQDGFGWTNGVSLLLLDRFGERSAERSAAEQRQPTPHENPSAQPPIAAP